MSQKAPITKNQKEILDYIHQYLEKNGYAPTQKEIKNHFNLKSYGSVQRYIKYLSNAGHLATDWNARRGLRPVDTDEHLSHGEIPLLGKVAAGNPIEAIENAHESIAVPQNLLRPPHKYFALRVQGDSMIEDGILENDVVIVRHQKDAKNGQTVVAIIEGEATLKHYYKKSNSIELRPANALYSPIVVKATSSQEFNLAGVMVGLIRICQ